MKIMTREETIKALERCTHGEPCKDCICFSNQVESGGDTIACMDALMHKALTLLQNETVVRCKECKYVQVYNDGAGHICYLCGCEGHDDMSVSDDWYCADGKRKKKMITSAACRAIVNEEEHVFPVHRHCDFFDWMHMLGCAYDKNKVEQGFIDEYDNFYTRQEAAKIAWESKQIDKPLKTLYSEDLY